VIAKVSPPHKIRPSVHGLTVVLAFCDRSRS
jgi:hypothetical protein